MRATLSTLILASLAAAGCVTPPENVEGAALDPLAQAAAATQTSYTFDGEFGLTVGGCPMVAPCVWYGVGGESSSEALDVAGALTAANLTMTWDAAGPTSETMHFGLWWGAEGEEGASEYVTGSSPLVLEVTDLDIPEGDEIWIWAWPASTIPVGTVQYTTPQSFTVEGTLTTTEAPTTTEA